MTRPLPHYLVKSPIALFFFNRFDTTLRVLSAIKASKPQVLYLISDGPRPNRPDEQDAILTLRAAVESEIDWDCRITKIYAIDNMGCKQRIISGVTRVLTAEASAIFLEDDCVPTQSFFKFCDDALANEKDNHEIYSISGSNFSHESKVDPGCFLSPYALMWGWATWSDRWGRYDPYPKNWPRTLLNRWWKRPLELLYWIEIFYRISKGQRESVWDYQWILTHWRERARSLRPTHNLVENIGFGEKATHTKGSSRFSHVVTKTDLATFYAGDYDFDSQEECTRADREYWAMINFKSLIYMYLPVVKRARVLLQVLRRS